ncbi:MAG: flippase-like domain-containing protein [Chloroflexi bacterium]|nr:flippase-like domain-containing protein [Chloroflexota bacterium]
MMTPTVHTSRRGVAILGARFGLGLAIGGAALWFLLSRIEWPATLAYLARISLVEMAASLCLVGFGSFLGAMRWKLLLGTDGISPGRLFFVQNTAHGVDVFSPLRIFSIPVQVLMLTKSDGLPIQRVFASIAGKRFMDALVMGGVVVVGALLTHSLWPMLAFALPLTTWAVAAWGSVLTIGKALAAKPAPQPEPATPTPPSLRQGRSRLQLLGVTLSLTLASWMAIGLAGWVLASSVGLEIGVWHAIPIAVGTILIAGALPGLPAAFGLFEATFVHLMGLLGYSADQALAAALFFHAVLILPALGCAVVAFFKELPSPLQILSQVHKAGLVPRHGGS